MRPIILCITSPHEIEVSRTLGARMWKDFLAGRASSHSGRASTLPYLVRRAEREGIPYTITAIPGSGYSVRRMR